MCCAGLRVNLRKLQGFLASLSQTEPASESQLSLCLTARWQMLIETKSEVPGPDRGRKFQVQTTQSTQVSFQFSDHIHLYRSSLL